MATHTTKLKEVEGDLREAQERFRIQRKNYLDLCYAIIGKGTVVDNDPFAALSELKKNLAEIPELRKRIKILERAVERRNKALADMKRIYRRHFAKTQIVKQQPERCLCSSEPVNESEVNENCPIHGFSRTLEVPVAQQESTPIPETCSLCRQPFNDKCRAGICLPPQRESAPTAEQEKLLIDICDLNSELSTKLAMLWAEIFPKSDLSKSIRESTPSPAQGKPVAVSVEETITALREIEVWFRRKKMTDCTSAITHAIKYLTAASSPSKHLKPAAPAATPKEKK